MITLKVSAKSNPNMVAGALAGVIREQGAAELQVIGASAVNQAVKSIAIACSFFEDTTMNLICVPSFITVSVGGDEKTAIKFVIETK